ncbi:MAG: TetR/AcrR family transcriptional regulator [Nitrosopumilus sp.]|nr:TetR/AcrR family transcriptional regulator [Nitrosopumilus sp.]
MSPKVSAQYQAETRDRIISSAVINFSLSGFDKTRMEDIAIDADVSKGTLYLYFKSKDDLFYAICQNNLNKLKGQLDALFGQSKGDLLYSAEKFYDSFQDMVKDGEQKIAFEIISECSRNQRLRKVMYEQRMNTLGIVSECLNLQIEKGFFKKDVDVNAIACGLVSLYDGLSLNKIIGISNDFNKSLDRNNQSYICKSRQQQMKLTFVCYCNIQYNN